MLTRIGVFMRSFQRLFSRSEWLIRVLKLSKCEGQSTRPGLVLVQIDGLSRLQMNRAMARGNLPFLSRLIRKERHVAHPLYSGLPSNTPAFQAELFYGVKGAVPAFSFFDSELGRVVRMYDPWAASKIERRIEKEGEPLLRGGSAYSNVFTGGAEESHFCASKIGWDGLKRLIHPFALPFLIFFYVDVILRVVLLFFIELFLAVIDCLRGTVAGGLFWEELKFIPTRVAVSIVLRELIVAGAKLDLARGLPVIHMNFLGYDEQSHRRGPSSTFAHWSLRGIDYAVERLWKAALQSECRYYDVWVYSDHGQEETAPYPLTQGRTLEEAVSEIFNENVSAEVGAAHLSEKHQVRRCSAKRRGWNAQSQFPIASGRSERKLEGSDLVMTAMGPLAHIYPDRAFDPVEKERIARSLVEKANIPLVLVPERPDHVFAWTDKGRFRLPEDGVKIFGSSHPFSNEISEDMVRLCHHPDAGQFILCGWRRDKAPLTFPLENGSHAGAGIEETSAFCIVSADAQLRFREHDYVRAVDLREAARRFLGRVILPWTPPPGRARSERGLRVMTYNVHGCVGVDGRLSPERIARVIARHDPDIVALQELDAGRMRSGGIDQAGVIAQKLGMQFHFHPVICQEDERYGNAILSKRPAELVGMGCLPRYRQRAECEPRGIQWIVLDVDGVPVQFLNCHLSIWPRERLAQAQALMGKEWIGRAPEGPLILCGDFNALPGSAAYRVITSKLHDAQLNLNTHRPHSTWFGRYPFTRIDYLFTSHDIHVERIRVPATELEKAASDHLPLVVDFRVPAPAIKKN